MSMITHRHTNPLMYTEGVPHHNTVNTNTNPIDLALAIALSSLEAALWLINELLGFHTATEVAPVAAQTAPAAPTTAPKAIDKAFILSLTVRQLKDLTGIKSSRYNKAALQSIALGVAT